MSPQNKWKGGLTTLIYNASCINGYKHTKLAHLIKKSETIVSQALEDWIIFLEVTVIHVKLLSTFVFITWRCWFRYICGSIIINPAKFSGIVVSRVFWKAASPNWANVKSGSRGRRRGFGRHWDVYSAQSLSAFHAYPRRLSQHCTFCMLLLAHLLAEFEKTSSKVSVR